MNFFLALLFTALLAAPVLACDVRRPPGAAKAHCHSEDRNAQPPMHHMQGNASFDAATERMHRAMEINYTGHADTDFAAAMIPHHQGAVEMAEIELREGRDPAMRWLAQRILTWQETEIGEMQHWLARREYRGQLTNARSTGEYEAAMGRMMLAMHGAQADDIDHAFALGMIPHHRAAIDMAATELKYGTDPEMRAFAHGVIRAQTAEIGYMKSWLNRRRPSVVSHQSSAGLRYNDAPGTGSRRMETGD